MKKLRRGSFTRKYLKRISKKNSKLKKVSAIAVLKWANGLFELQNRKESLSITEGTSKPCCSSLSSNWLRKVRKIQRCPEGMGLSRLRTFRSKRIIWTNCTRLNLSSPDETKLFRGNRAGFERYVCVHRFEIITDRHNNDAVLFGHLEHHRKFSGVRNYNEKPRHEVCVPWDLQTAFFVKLLWALS